MPDAPERGRTPLSRGGDRPRSCSCGGVGRLCARVAGVGAIFGCAARWSVRDPRPLAARSSWDSPSGPGWAGSALRAAVGWVAGWENYRPCGRVARCSSCLPDLRTSRSGRGARQLPGAHAALKDQHHRIVAWAPGSDGLVGNSRAPASGTAARATTGSVVLPTPATSKRKRSGVQVACAGSRGRCAAAGGRGVSGRRAKPSVHGQVDTTALGSRSNNHGVDMTMNRSHDGPMIVAKCGSAPTPGRSASSRIDQQGVSGRRPCWRPPSRPAHPESALATRRRRA